MTNTSLDRPVSPCKGCPLLGPKCFPLVCVSRFFTFSFSPGSNREEFFILPKVLLFYLLSFPDCPPTLFMMPLQSYACDPPPLDLPRGTSHFGATIAPNFPFSPTPVRKPFVFFFPQLPRSSFRTHSVSGEAANCHFPFDPRSELTPRRLDSQLFPLFFMAHPPLPVVASPPPFLFKTTVP